MERTATPPETRYAKSGDVHIAYQVVGDGPFDLVHIPGFVSHLECAWEWPSLARFYERLASFSRLILFDKRGTGLSDRVQIATLEQRMDDVRAVMDAVGSDRAALFGVSEGGPMSALFAATYPERTTAIVTFGTAAARSWAPDDPGAPMPAQFHAFFEAVERDWGARMRPASALAHRASLMMRNSASGRLGTVAWGPVRAQRPLSCGYMQRLTCETSCRRSTYLR